MNARLYWFFSPPHWSFQIFMHSVFTDVYKMQLPRPLKVIALKSHLVIAFIFEEQSRISGWYKNVFTMYSCWSSLFSSQQVYNLSAPNTSNIKWLRRNIINTIIASLGKWKGKNLSAITSSQQVTSFEGEKKADNSLFCTFFNCDLHLHRTNHLLKNTVDNIDCDQGQCEFS